MGQLNQLPNRSRGEFGESRLEAFGSVKFGVTERGRQTGTGVMQCTYCHAWNDLTAQRCLRCGRRGARVTPGKTEGETPRESPGNNPRTSYPFMTATSLALDVQEDFGPEPAASRSIRTENKPPIQPGATAAPVPSAPSVEPQAPAGVGGGTQPWLFRASDMGRPKVVPIPVLTPRLDPVPRKRRMAGARPSRAARRDSRQDGLQHLLDLQESATEAMLADTVIDCDAAVAPTAQRLVAALFDGAVVGVAVAAFFSIYYLAGGSFGWDKQTLLLVSSTMLMLALLYRVFWWLGNGDSPGTCSAGMRVINFDGRRPDRKQRGRRLAAGVLSLLSVGLGLLWVLVDEEGLSWHDHISKTFPTPV